MNEFKTIMIDKSDLEVLIYILDNININNMPYNKVKLDYLKKIKDRINLNKYNNIKKNIELENFEILEEIKQNISNVFINYLIIYKNSGIKNSLANEYFNSFSKSITDGSVFDSEKLNQIQKINYCCLTKSSSYIEIEDYDNYYVNNSIIKLSKQKIKSYILN